MRKAVLAAAIFAMFSAPSFAQNENTTHFYSPNGWSYGAEFSSVSFDSDTALQEGIEDKALLIGLGVNYRSSSFITSASLDFILYDDNEEFSQLVVGDGLLNDGDVSVESSDASAIGFTLASGYEWKFGENDRASGILQGGLTGVFGSERSIANCSNCSTEDIDIDGGFFIGGKLGYHMESFSVGLSARQYLSGDGLSNVFGITFDTKF
jgi:hypothetical protein